MKSKRGVFFIIDILFAFLILSIGVVIILSSTIQPTNTQQASNSAHDFLQQLTSIQVQNVAVDSILQLRDDKNIIEDDFDKPLLEKIYEFNVDGKDELSALIIKDLVLIHFLEIYNAEFYINDDLVYNHSVHQRAKDDSIVIRQKSFALVNDNFQPKFIIGEVVVW